MKNFRNLFGLVLGRVGSSSPSLLAGWQPASTTETDRTPSLPLPHLPAPVAPPPFRGAQTVFFRRNKGGGTRGYGYLFQIYSWPQSGIPPTHGVFSGRE